MADGKEIQTKGHQDLINSVAFSPNGQFIASGSHDKTIRIWNLADDKEIQKLEGHENWINSVAFSPDGQFIASGSHDKTIRIWNWADGK